METTAYLIVTDLHNSYKNFSNRVDYRKEMVGVYEHLISIASKYKKQGYNVVLLLLGDVFHNSYNDVFNAVIDNNFFITWRQQVGEIFSVLGNHELHFYSSNPFYTLISSIESQKVQTIMNCVWEPVGTSSTIRVVDQLKDGNTIFHFNHYQTEVDKVEKDGNVHIGLFHQEIVSQEILDSMRGIVDSEIFATVSKVEGSKVFENYNYCFMGHMHKVYGTFLLDSGCYVQYLASLGRTNVSEVLNTFLERDIPAVIVRDHKFDHVENNKFSLMRRDLCVKENIVQIATEKYEIQKEKKAIKQYDSASDDPIKNLCIYFADSSRILKLVEELNRAEIDDRGYRLRSLLTEDFR